MNRVHNGISLNLAVGTGEKKKGNEGAGSYVGMEDLSGSQLSSPVGLG